MIVIGCLGRQGMSGALCLGNAIQREGGLGLSVKDEDWCLTKVDFVQQSVEEVEPLVSVWYAVERTQGTGSAGPM
jgi:hypothetical protein